MITSASCKVCIVDGLEPRHSPAYHQVKSLCGKKVADLLVEEVEVIFKPPDEVSTHVEDPRTTPDRLGAAG